MFNEKVKYVLIGAFCCLLAVMFLSAGDVPEKEVGRYQIAATTHASAGIVFVIDTKTGVVKYVCNMAFPGNQQLGIPFEQMSAR